MSKDYIIFNKFISAKVIQGLAKQEDLDEEECENSS